MWRDTTSVYGFSQLCAPCFLYVQVCCSHRKNVDSYSRNFGVDALILIIALVDWLKHSICEKVFLTISFTDMKNKYLSQVDTMLTPRLNQSRFWLFWSIVSSRAIKQQHIFHVSAMADRSTEGPSCWTAGVSAEVE